MLSASSCRCKHLFFVTNAVTGFVKCISLVDSGLAKRRCDRRLRTFWRHEHQSIKMAVATTTHCTYTLRCVTQVSIARGTCAHVVARSSELAIAITWAKSRPSRRELQCLAGIWIHNVSNQTESMFFSTVEPIRCRKEGESSRYQRF